MSKIEHLEAPISGRPSPSAFTDLPGHKNDAIALRRRAAGSSFFSAMRLLPARRREAMYALCAFCREVDYVADSEASRSQKQALLLKWRSEIAHLFRPTLLRGLRNDPSRVCRAKFRGSQREPGSVYRYSRRSGARGDPLRGDPGPEADLFPSDASAGLRPSRHIPFRSRNVLAGRQPAATTGVPQSDRNHLLHFFGERLSEYGGESFSVTGSRTDPACIIVTSRIIRPQEAPIERRLAAQPTRRPLQGQRCRCRWRQHGLDPALRGFGDHSAQRRTSRRSPRDDPRRDVAR